MRSRRLLPVLCAALVACSLCVALPVLADAPRPAPGSIAGPPACAPGEVIVQFSLDGFHADAFRPSLLAQGRTGLAEVDAKLSALSARECRPVIRFQEDQARLAATGLDRFYVVRFDAATDPREAALLLSGTEGIERAEPNGVYEIQLVPNDPRFDEQWAHLNTGQAASYPDGDPVGTPGCDMKTTEAWDILTGGAGVVIAIIDTGCDYRHPEFSGRTVAGYDFVQGDAKPLDDNGHGTCCAGIALAAGNNGRGVAGVAWGARLMPIKVMTDEGWGYWEWIANGVTWAADRGADVISMSLGGYDYSALLESACNYAFGRGCTVFASSGNDDWDQLGYPAYYANVIGVGALSPCCERKSWYTCDGEWWWGSNYGDDLDFMAPGTRIVTTDILGPGGFASGDYFDEMNGTSAACPHAAGVGALMLAFDPTLTNQQVRTLMRQSCDPLNRDGWDYETGYGAINARRALEYVYDPPQNPPEDIFPFPQGFEKGLAPFWMAEDLNGANGEDYWGTVHAEEGAQVAEGEWSVYCDAEDGAPESWRYDNNMTADLTMKDGVDLSGYTGVEFSFWLWHKTYNSNDYLSFQTWNGAGWTEVGRWSGDSNGWKQIQYALTDWQTFRCRFRFYSNSAGITTGVFLDGMVLRGSPIDDENRPMGAPSIVWLGEVQAPTASVSLAGSEALRAQVSPNPVRDRATVRFTMPAQDRAIVDLFSPDGRRIATVCDRDLPAGEQEIVFDRGGLPAGVYFIRIRAEGIAPRTERILVLD